MESEKKRQEREEREKLQRHLEKQEALKMEKKFRREMFFRKIQLRGSGNVFKLYDQIIFDYLQRKKSIHEWEVFTSCRNTPYLNALNEINSYISSWEAEMEETTVQKVLDKIPETILFINEMKNFLTLPFDSAYAETVHEIGLIYQKLKYKLGQAIDSASFSLMKNLEELFDPEIGVFASISKSPKMSHCLWGNLYMCPEYDSYIYEDVKFRFKIPDFLMKIKGIYRLVKLEYDHLSDSSYSYFPPGLHDALRSSIDNWVLKNNLMRVQPSYKESPSEKKAEEEKSAKEKKKDSKNVTKERPKTEAELAKERERVEKNQFIPTLRPDELNLRNFAIQGGIYNFRLLAPRNEKKTRGHWTLQYREDADGVLDVEFSADYVAPATADMAEMKKTPEEMEREAKRQEEELKKLVQLDIEVPRTALWFEPPIPVRWLEHLRIWSKEGFFDLKFSEDSLQLSIKTIRLGIIAFAHNRWANLPYQSWELRPTGENKVLFSLMAAIAVIDFTIHNDLICVSSIQNVSNSRVVEDALLNNFMKPQLLIQTLRYHGLDVFPQFDSYAYVDGILIKNILAEDHLYQCMALTACAYNYQWSRWNLLAGREKMIYQIRERTGTATPGNYAMILNTPMKASLINCTEVSPNYSEDPMEPNE